jgi:hypothetical protein
VAIPLAVFIHTRLQRLRDVAIGAYFLPYITSTVAIAILFSSLFSTDYGIVNSTLRSVFGITNIDWLGDPDHGVIVASYLGSWLLSGAMLAVGSALSALTRNQVVAFVVTVVVCFALMLAGHPLVQDAVQGWAPRDVIDAVAALSFLTHVQSIQRGVLDLRDVLFFLLSIAAWLCATVLILDAKKAG